MRNCLIFIGEMLTFLTALGTILFIFIALGA